MDTPKYQMLPAHHWAQPKQAPGTQIPSTREGIVEELELKAVAIRATRNDLTKEQAFTMVLESNPALYDAFIKKHRERAFRKAAGLDT